MMLKSVAGGLLILFLLVANNQANAQSAWETTTTEDAIAVLKQINKKMTLTKTIEMDIEHKVIDLHDSSIVLLSQGYFKRKDSVFLKNMSFGIETIQNEKYKVVVDSQAKSVVVSNPSNMSPVNDLAQLEKNFLLYPVAQVLKRHTNGHTSFIIKFSDRDFALTQMSFTYDEAFLLTEFFMDLNQSANETHPDAKTRTIMTFSNYKVNKKLNDNVFSIHHIIDAKNERITVKGSFTNYELINIYR